MIKDLNSFVLLLIALCCSTVIYAQKKPDIKGNRSVAVVDKALDAFHSIVVEEELDLSFKKGDTPLVHFVADDNLPPVFKFEVIDSVLHISSYYRIKSKRELQIQVNYVSLKSIEVNGGLIKLDINSNPLALSVSASNKSDLDIKGISDQVSLLVNDTSKVKLTASLKSLNIEAKDRSKVDLSGVFETTSVLLSDRSSLTALGTTSNLVLGQTADSYFYGKGLKVDQAILSLTNNSMADLYSLTKVDLSLDEQSILNFYGTAQLIVKQFLGTSQILKKAFNSPQQ